MLKVGLTGGIGSGKSVVARMFGVLGVPVYAADGRARTLMQEDARLREAVGARFGDGVFRDGQLDRAALAAVVFNDDEALHDLNALVHPAVRADFDHWAAGQEAPYVLMEAALMAENEGWRRFDRVITVACPEAERIRRVIQRDRTDEARVRARMRHQATEEQRLAIARHVFRNDGDELVIPQVLAIHQELISVAA